ncbi:nucleotidyltransferase [Brevibacillus dissolubilis]|uniref:nucleotidyltransferase n=1 Tax=Brevibacillus dissolubilis TaxID=1844116 RepID=UPI0011173839|nr:nucleotidyltransferase [Brevibacillus dissolubilis]
MKTVGLVVEYNPLHNGHRYHYEAAKEATGADACVIVMSGNFLQRGEPALVSKWARAEMALRLGVDLVIELPVPYATATAELFALGAVSIMDRLGVVDAVCFGSESGDIEWMRPLARVLADEPPAFAEALREGLSEGLPYPSAYARAAGHYMQAAGYGTVPIDQPNNILGLNYLIALERLGSRMEAATIKRQKAEYHQETITDARIASATALRKLLFEDRAPLGELASYVPKTTLDVLKQEFAAGYGPMSWDAFRQPLFHRLLTMSPAELAGYHEVEEGIEHRIMQAVKSASSVQEIIAMAKTKRFTWNRLQRMLLSVLLDLTKSKMQAFDLKSGAPYARVLGFSDRGRELLHLAKTKSTIPLYTNVRDGLHPMLDVDIRANAVYRLAQPQTGDRPFTEEYRSRPLTSASVSAASDN